MANGEELQTGLGTGGIEINQNSPEILTNPIYTPAFFKRTNRQTYESGISNRNK